MFLSHPSKFLFQGGWAAKLSSSDGQRIKTHLCYGLASVRQLDPQSGKGEAY